MGVRVRGFSRGRKFEISTNPKACCSALADDAVLYCCLLGLGMCLAMGALGDGGGLAAAGGIILGLLGMAGAGLNYPIYKKLLSAGKEKYAFEIIQLAREISESAE